ncbi:MAG TPA: peptidase M56, partial [Flavobacterium alvei]|nr:peptidase M56 [Flavobacterium alvei]
METLFIFLVKASGLIGIFYLAYILLLRKETFFNSNRWFLLAGLITSILLPLVVFTKIVWVEPTPTNFDWSNI